MLVSLLRTLMTSPGVNGENPAMLRRGDRMVEMVDALFIRSAQPQRGSVVFCRLVGMLEHTGICIGDDRIVHLDGSGLVEEVGPSEFMSRIEKCTKCGACGKRCPYGLKPWETLPAHLADYRSFVK